MNFGVPMRNCDGTASNDVVTLPGFVFLTTPAVFASGITLSNGVAQTFQISGLGTPAVPTTATAILMSGFGNMDTATGFIQANKQGSYNTGSAVNIMIVLAAAAGNWGNTVVVPLNNSNGKITIRADVGNAIATFTVLGYFN